MEHFSSTVAHITLLINHIIQTSGLAMQKYLDKTLRDVVPVAQWADLRRIGQIHSLWERSLKRLAIDNLSLATMKIGIDTEVYNSGHVSVRVPAGNDGDGGDSSPSDSSSDDEDADKDKKDDSGEESNYSHLTPNKTTLAVKLTLNLMMKIKHRKDQIRSRGLKLSFNRLQRKKSSEISTRSLCLLNRSVMSTRYCLRPVTPSIRRGTND